MWNVLLHPLARHPENQHVMAHRRYPWQRMERESLPVTTGNLTANWKSQCLIRKSSRHG